MDMNDEERHRQRMIRKKAVFDAKAAAAQDARGVLLVFTGNGKGKSTAAFGLLARAIGHGQRAAVVQFVKSRRDTGEEAFFRTHPNVSWHLMGEGFTWETQDKARDTAAAQAAWAQAVRYLGDPAVGLVILDELTYSFKYGWLAVDDVIATFKNRPAMQHVVVTGRAAPSALVDAADTVSEIAALKHAFQAGVPALPGVEF